MSAPPFDDRDGYIWFDGELVPWRSAKLHVLSHALHYASSVFEGIRAYGGKPFKLQEHSERLVLSAQIMGIKLPYTADQLTAATMETVRANNLSDGYIRPVAWRGSEEIGVGARITTIHVAIAGWVWPQYFSFEARLKGISLLMSKWRRPDPATAPIKAKAAGLYMICTLSKNDAEIAGYDDALFLDWRGRVAEATGANIFFVFDGEIHTPTPDCFLDGITRRTVIDLAKKRGYKIVERTIMPEEMADAQECFLTGTAVEVTPVRLIGEEYKFTPGDICRNLMSDFDALVGRVDTASSAA
jgi:branched-chain amino acid aminotransferase